MKKILLLGGSVQQVVAIETAKRLGYYTVLCDYLTDNPGQYVADKFYLVSTTDKEKVLEVAQNEKIDGILAYASDPAAPTSAYVAEQLYLPGNPYRSVEILCNKDKFRQFLSENGFCTPKAKGYADLNLACSDIESGYFQFPIIVKPTDSSGSKGVTVVKNVDAVDEALHFAFGYSRCHKIIVEEYVEKNHEYLVGGDIFIIDGEIVLWGLLNCHRDKNANPLVPVGKSFPLQLTISQINLIKETLQRLVSALKINFGAMNVELVVDKNNGCYVLDAGPRAGGNMIPEFLGMIFHVDIVKLIVEGSMGCDVVCCAENKKSFWATYNLHSDRNGLYKRIVFSRSLEKYIVQKKLYKAEGDIVEHFSYASDALGIIFMKFENEETMFHVLGEISKEISVELK